MTNTATLSEVQLRQFTGSENWYRHGINRAVLYTDGAKYVADQGGAYWLLDIIAIAQLHDKSVSAEEFQVWNLRVHSDRSATVFCDDGNGNPVYTQEIPFTDFPVDEVKLYFANNVIHLPSEYSLGTPASAFAGAGFSYWLRALRPAAKTRTAAASFLSDRRAPMPLILRMALNELFPRRRIRSDLPFKRRPN